MGGGTGHSGPPSRARFESELVRRILSGAHPDGSKLPSERVLAETSGLSRPVVREVLRGLVERGLVEVVPARGAFVRAPDAMHLADMMGSVARYRRATPRDLVEAREMIESATARSAADRVIDDDIRLLRELVAAFDGAGTTLERARCDLALHASIARLSGNPVLEVMFGAITPMVLDLQLRSLADPLVLEAGGPLHHDVVEALAAHDPAAAATAMARHVSLALELYGDDLDVPLDVLAEQRLPSILGEGMRIDDMLDPTLGGRREDPGG